MTKLIVLMVTFLMAMASAAAQTPTPVDNSRPRIVSGQATTQAPAQPQAPPITKTEVKAMPHKAKPKLSSPTATLIAQNRSMLAKQNQILASQQEALKLQKAANERAEKDSGVIGRIDATLAKLDAFVIQKVALFETSVASIAVATGLTYTIVWWFGLVFGILAIALMIFGAVMLLRLAWSFIPAREPRARLIPAEDA